MGSKPNIYKDTPGMDIWTTLGGFLLRMKDLEDQAEVRRLEEKRLNDLEKHLKDVIRGYNKKICLLEGKVNGLAIGLLISPNTGLRRNEDED